MTEPIHDLARIGHAELLTPKPEESLRFFVDVLGMEEEARDGQSVFLRGWGDYLRYSLKLTESPRAGLGHVALRAWSPEALDRRVAAVEATGRGLGWIDGDVGHGPAYRFTDPDGHVFELYYEAERYEAPEHLRPSWRNQPQRYVGRGAAVKRLDHVNLLAADVRANSTFAQDVLGYRLYERIELDDGTETGAWLSLSIAAHELIYVADAYGATGRLHHLAFWVDTREECLRAADIFVDHGVPIEAAPSKHGVAQGFFLYGFEPGGNRIEVTTGGYFVYDPDFEPITWTAAERARGQYWGVKTIESFHTYGTPDVDGEGLTTWARSATPSHDRAASSSPRSSSRAVARSPRREAQGCWRSRGISPRIRRIDVLSITDNPGGHAMLSPDALGTDLISRGQEVIIHLACKDWNRNALESRGWQLSSAGFQNVLALSGDYPVMGHRGLAAPVFDIDSVGLISLFADMNAGLPDVRRPTAPLQRTDFFLGGVVTNHKRHEREVMPQYFKLRKKVRAGARFVINQAGWNTRKDDELLRWIRRDGLDLHVLANVYLLSRTAARAFHRGIIPGIVVTDELLALAERHGASPDKGRAFFVDLASKHLAVVRGLGYDGVYLGGHMPAETFGEIIERAERLRRRRLARVRARDPVPASGGVPLLRARSGDGSLVRRRERRLPRVEATAANRPARSGQVPAQPPPPRGGVRERRPALHDRTKRLRPHREGPASRAAGRPCARAGRQGAAVRVQGLRRLLASRDRLRLPGVAVREEPAQRPLWRDARRPVRGLRHRVHLVGGVRAAQGLRRGGVDARRAGRRQGQRAGRDERMGEHVPRPRPPGALDLEPHAMSHARYGSPRIFHASNQKT